MRVIQLNVWTCRLKGALERFVRENDADILCLQEAVWCDEEPGQLAYLFDTVEKLQKAGKYPYVCKTANFGVKFRANNVVQHGNVILSKIPIKDSETKFIYGSYTEDVDFVNGGDLIYSAQKIVLENDLVVLNYHGYWDTDPMGGEKHVECMHKVADMIRDEERPVIMCGDLNVVAESPAMRELDFLHNLTAEHHLAQTLQNLKFIKNVACDHILVNDKIKVNEFRALDQLASDHKALQADFEII